MTRPSLVATALVLPIAAPAWGLERLIRRRKHGFEFGLVTSIPYFSIITLGATVVVCVANTTLAWLGLLVLASMELVALSVALAVGIGDRATFQRFVADVARRRVDRNYRSRPSYAVLASVCALGYSVWFFACIAMMFHRFTQAQLTGIPTGLGPAGAFWQCVYYSAMTIVTGSSTVVAVGGWAQLVSMIEVIVGLVFFAFVIAVISGRHTSQLDS